MAQESKPSSQEGNIILQEFEYGRELFVQLFKDDTPFVNLGYTPKQKALAKRALQHLEEEGSVSQTTPRTTSHFGIDDEFVTLFQLKHGGYGLHAIYAPAEYHMLGTDQQEKIRKELTFFEADFWGKVTFIDMIPEGVNYEDLRVLIPHLYQGNEVTLRNVPIEPANPLSKTKAFFFSTSTYKAVWVDDITKLELVVETDFADKDLEVRRPKQAIDVWRRLPVIELDGKSWVPFGKKPGISGEATQKAFEGQKGRVVVGSLATELDKE